MKRQTLALVLAAAAALGAGLWIGDVVFEQARQRRPDVGQTAFIYPEPVPVPEFSLTADDGTTFDKERLRGKWSFLFFGYTNCPDVCPMTLNMFKQVHDLLAASEGGVADTQFVFVSVDPERDTPETLHGFVRFFNPELIGATGDPEMIDRLTSAFRILYMKVPAEDGGSYLVDHSSAVLLTSPDGDLYAVFTSPHQATAIAEAFDKIRAADG